MMGKSKIKKVYVLFILILILDKYKIIVFKNNFKISKCFNRKMWI